jgi:hypothetical protein
MTLPLFPTELTVLIEPTVAKLTLTKTQKQFNSLVKKIEALKAQLAEWQDVVPRHSERIHREYQPLRDAFNALRVELVNLLDRARTEKRLTKNEIKKLKHLIPLITAELMTEQPSDAVKALHDKYSDIGYDEQNDEADDALKSMMGEVFGLDVDDDVDINDPEQLRVILERRVQEDRDSLQHQQHESDARRNRSKKSARQLDREQQKKSDAALVQKSLQEVFRKLVAALHPDRAPDDAERERRTELMQRVNVAYEKKDLLLLLELQVQIEQVGKTVISAQSDERLKHFNQLLKEQCDTLSQALAEAQLPFRYQLGLPPFAPLSVKVLVAHMEQDVRSIKASVVSLKADLRLFQDPARLKAWLRDFEISKEPEFDDVMDVFSMSPFGAK